MSCSSVICVHVSFDNSSSAKRTFLPCSISAVSSLRASSSPPRFNGLTSPSNSPTAPYPAATTPECTPYNSALSGPPLLHFPVTCVQESSGTLRFLQVCLIIESWLTLCVTGRSSLFCSSVLICSFSFALTACFFSLLFLSLCLPPHHILLVT